MSKGIVRGRSSPDRNTAAATPDAVPTRFQRRCCFRALESNATRRDRPGQATPYDTNRAEEPLGRLGALDRAAPHDVHARHAVRGGSGRRRGVGGTAHAARHVFLSPPRRRRRSGRGLDRRNAPLVDRRSSWWAQVRANLARGLRPRPALRTPKTRSPEGETARRAEGGGTAVFGKRRGR